MKTTEVLTGWVRAYPGRDDYAVLVNEWQGGGYGYEFTDFKPRLGNYRPIYITLENPAKVLEAANAVANKWVTEAADLSEKLETALARVKVCEDALERIQHAYGSPNDEDYVTTEARDALAASRGMGK